LRRRWSAGGREPEIPGFRIYTQVIDAAVRAAIAKVGDELFTIVHRPSASTELTR
jgi:hypothetical protein